MRVFYQDFNLYYFSDYHYLIVVLSALTLDWILGEAKRFHPLVIFGKFADRLELALYPSTIKHRKLLGVTAVLISILPFLILVVLVSLALSGAGILLLEIILLYFAIGNKSLIQHANRVLLALRTGDLEQAREHVSMIVSRETRTMKEPQITSATIESVLENGNDAVFAVIFWYLFLGAPGIILYRLSNTLDAMWGYKNQRYIDFGWAAAKLDDLLNWLPSRLCACTYALVGNIKSAKRSWSTQSNAWESPNAGVVMSTGAGALGITLGGGAYYHGEYVSRPVIGFGKSPESDDISRAIKLIQYGLLVWLAALAVGSFIFA